jgi:hypothetical protein
MHRCAAATLAIIVLAAGSTSFARGDDRLGTWPADCGFRAVSVVHDNPSELDAACSALVDVIGYFRRQGFELEPRISLHIADRAIGAPTEHASAHGYFDPVRGVIVVYRTSDVRPWDLPWSLEMMASFLRHELAHMAVWEIHKVGTVRLRREWHEFVAYAVQLDRLGARVLRDILTKHADIQAFNRLTQVNELSYGMNPEAFAVAAYKTYVARSGPALIRQLLVGELLPPEPAYPFPVVPGRQ